MMNSGTRIIHIFLFKRSEEKAEEEKEEEIYINDNERNPWDLDNWRNSKHISIHYEPHTFLAT